MNVRMSIAICMMAAAGTLGCGGWRETVVKGFYVGTKQVDDGCAEIVINSRFTAPQEATIIAAIDQWNTALDGYIDMSWRRADIVVPAAGAIAIADWAGTIDDTVGDMAVWPRIGMIVANIDGNDEFSRVAAHEFGHWFGLEHNDDDGSIMQAHLNDHTGPTQVDVFAFHAFLADRVPCTKQGQ